MKSALFGLYLTTIVWIMKAHFHYPAPAWFAAVLPCIHGLFTGMVLRGFHDRIFRGA